MVSVTLLLNCGCVLISGRAACHTAKEGTSDSGNKCSVCGTCNSIANIILCMNKLLGRVFSVEDFPSNLTCVLGFITAEEQGQFFTASKI